MIPGFRIKSGVKDLTAAIQLRLLRLSIRDEAKLKSDSLCLELADDPPIVWPSTGQVFEVALGYDDQLVDMGTYAVKHIAVASPPRVLKIEASALEQGPSLKNQREQAWEETTLESVVGTIARRNGLIPAVIPELAAIRIEREDQTESDISFLNRLGRRFDLVIKVSSRHLIAAPTDKSRKASGGELPQVTIRNPISYEYSSDQTKKYTGVRAFWYDSNAAAKRFVMIGRQGVVLELEYNKIDESGARRAAEKAFRDVVRKGKTLSLTVTGNPELAAERKIIAQGLGKGIDGVWVIKSVEHTIDASGFISTAQCSVDGYKETAEVEDVQDRSA